MADNDSILLNKDYLYDLLGCDELSTEEQIIREYKIRAKSLHPDKNSGNEERTSEFIKLKEAKEILCNKEKRKKYDFWRRAGLAVPFDVWLKNDKLNHMSVHWAPKPKKEKMIESCTNKETAYNKDDTGAKTSIKASSQRLGKTNASQEPLAGWKSKSSWGDSNLYKFRNYLI